MLPLSSRCGARRIVYHRYVPSALRVRTSTDSISPFACAARHAVSKSPDIVGMIVHRGIESLAGRFFLACYRCSPATFD